MSVKWSKVARGVLRKGVQPFDEADAACARMLAVLEAKVEVEDRVRRCGLPGELAGVEGLHERLCFALRAEAQKVLLRVSEVVKEDLYVCWKAMVGAVEDAYAADDNVGLEMSGGKWVVDKVVVVYGQQYWTRRQLVEGVDLTREDVVEHVREVARRWEEMSLHDADLGEFALALRVGD